MADIQGRSRSRWLVWAVLAVAGAGLLWWLGTAKFTFSSPSPAGAYRVDFYQASLLRRLAHQDMSDPGFVRLYRNRDNRRLGESAVFDMAGNGDVRWLMAQSGEVTVGVDVRFPGVPAE